MYAVIKDGGKQYRVKPGDRIWVDMKEDMNEGDTIEFEEVLLCSKDNSTIVGTPVIPETKVIGVVEGLKKGKKQIIMKFRRRKNSRTKKGHRQKYTQVNIKEIVSSNLG